PLRRRTNDPISGQGSELLRVESQLPAEDLGVVLAQGRRPTTMCPGAGRGTDRQLRERNDPTPGQVERLVPAAGRQMGMVVDEATVPDLGGRDASREQPAD